MRATHTKLCGNSITLLQIHYFLIEGIVPIGDYSPEQSAEQFLFRTGVSRVCGTIVVYRDSAFEFDEDFAGEVTGLRLDAGPILNSIPGVTVSPSRTEVLITDNNGKPHQSINSRLVSEC